jgi:RNA polymerase sigma-70 factor (ECF subfamily)
LPTPLPDSVVTRATSSAHEEQAMSLDEIINYALRRSSFKAWQMVGKYGFTKDDVEDIQQEIMLDILNRLPKFKRNHRGIRKFIRRLIDNRISYLKKHREAKLRDHRRIERGLDDWSHDEHNRWTSLGATITEDDALGHLGRRRLSSRKRIDLALDTVALLDQLSKLDRKLCLQLQAKTVSEISRQTGVVRTRIYERLRVIRQKFLQAGMDEYL